MAYKNLLVHLDDSKACAKRLDAAIAFAGAHDAHLTGLYVAAEAGLPSNLRAEVPAHLLKVLGEQVQERKARAVARYTKVFERNGLQADLRTAECPSARVADVIGLHARYADLVVLGQPEPDEAEEFRGHLAENVVLGSGRPGLIIPYIGARKTIGQRAMVAWDGGREAARAVNDALPALKQAESVVVLVINPHKRNHGQQPGADIALHLARHGIKVTVQQIEAGELSVADALLARLADQDVDLLVMGAYGHSRTREWILGGVTRQVFAQMSVPVIMAH